MKNQLVAIIGVFFISVVFICGCVQQQNVQQPQPIQTLQTAEPIQSVTPRSESTISNESIIGTWKNFFGKDSIYESSGGE